jgi:1-acyl-sn-glycerol-3-phosphate acyltransferase
LLYSIIKLPARLAFYIWCRHITINKKEWLNAEGPLLIAANHPNSFLDAILLSSLMKQPVRSLARGDAFTNKFNNKLLRSLNMFPVYRLSEGAAHLEENYNTFDECLEVFKKNGVVLIFSEGKCINEWSLRPLKKGTARLALQAWEQGIPLKILPLGFNYSSFTLFGKNIKLNFGNVITQQTFPQMEADSYGTKIQRFNAALKAQLDQLVIHIKPANKEIIRKEFEVSISPLKKVLLAIPAAASFLLNAPLYIPVQKFAYKKFGKIDHYDSVVLGLLFLLYPFYLIVAAIAAGYIFGGYWWLLTFLIMPFCAWSYVQLKKQF